MSWCSMLVCFIFFNVVVLVQSSNTASGLTLRKAQKSITNLTRFQSTSFSEDSRDQTATNNSVGSQSPSIAEGFRYGKPQTSAKNVDNSQSPGITEACQQISVTNAVYQAASTGIYEEMSSSYNCAGRQSYSQLGSSNYMFYLSYGAWMIGPTRCQDEGGIAVASTAMTPDSVNSTWNEFDGTSWVFSDSLQVACDYFSPCDPISVTNAIYQTAGTGIYEKMASAYGCAGRPSYSQLGSSNYIFYLSDGTWMIGPTRCQDVAGIAVVSTAMTPDSVNSTWQEYNGTSWVYSYSLQVACDYSSPCDPISVKNAIYQTTMHGIYETMPTSYGCAGRLSYSQIGSSNYIFYRSDGAWMIGPTRCQDVAGIAVVSTAMTPDSVNSTWQEYNGTSWVYSYSLQVACDYSSQPSSDFPTTEAPSSGFPNTTLTSSGCRIHAWFIVVVVVTAIAPTALSI